MKKICLVQKCLEVNSPVRAKGIWRKRNILTVYKCSVFHQKYRRLCLSASLLHANSITGRSETVLCSSRYCSSSNTSNSNLSSNEDKSRQSIVPKEEKIESISIAEQSKETAAKGIRLELARKGKEVTGEGNNENSSNPSKIMQEGEKSKNTKAADKIPLEKTANENIDETVLKVMRKILKEEEEDRSGTVEKEECSKKDKKDEKKSNEKKVSNEKDASKSASDSASKGPKESKKREKKEKLNDLINVTEVTTPSGVVWVDVRGKDLAIQKGSFKKYKEGEFASLVMKSLQGKKFPDDLYVNLSSGNPLPFTHVEKNWICLILRVVNPSESEFDAVDESNVLDASDIPNDEKNAAAQSRIALQRMLRRMYETNLEERTKKKKSSGKGEETDWIKEYTRLKGVEKDFDGDLHIEEASPDNYYYDEETNKFYLKDKQKWLGNLSYRRFSIKNFWRKGKSRPTRETKMALPTFTDLTDRLSIFILKELVAVDGNTTIDAEKTKKLAKIAGKLSFFVDEGKDRYDDMAFSFERNMFDVEEDASISSLEEAYGQKKSDGANDNSIKKDNSVQFKKVHGYTVVVVDKEEYKIRTRIITVHRYPIPYIGAILTNWSKLVNDKEETDAISGFSLNELTNMVSMRKAVITSWEDIVRLLFHGSIEGYQKQGLRNSHMLEYLEAAVFESENVPQRMGELTMQLTQLRQLSRRAKIYEHVLREMQLSYIKMRRVTGKNLSLKDKKDLSYLDSVLNLFRHTEEHSQTLLFLQLQVAMNEMTSHLQTLTTFTTFFIPLDFLTSFCGMQFKEGLISRLSISQGCLVLGGLFGFTGGATLLWIRRRLKQM